MGSRLNPQIKWQRILPRAHKDAERQLLSKEQVADNIEGQLRSFSKVLEFVLLDKHEDAIKNNYNNFI